MFKIPTDKLWVYPVFFGFIIRIYDIVGSSIWHDEGYTMWLLKYNPIEIIERTARDVHPPGYYLLAKPWVMIFGSSEFSIRFLSVIFSVGIIYLVFKIVEKLLSDKAAFWAATLVAFSPFMVRFAQEARMYGVVAFFTTLGTYCLVRFLKEKNNKLLIPYAISMAVAIYTQYYAFFVIMVHWLIVALVTPGFFTFRWGESFKKKFGLFDYKWWIAGLTPVILYLPWFPVAYKQVTRVSGSYWIKPEWINLRTIPNNLTQFVFYTHLDGSGYEQIIGKIFYWLVALMLIGGGLVLLYKKDLRRKTALFLLYGYVPMILVFTLSKLRTPIYQDRYFPFSAVAILALWGIGISIIKNKHLRIALGTVAIIVLILGNLQMHSTTSHKMEALYDAVKKEMRPGDIVLSGELYTFLDGAYYFGDGNISLISDPVDGYGETSLFYDQQDKYVVSEQEAIEMDAQSRVFIIGKTGDKRYFSGCLLDPSDSRVIYEDVKQNGVKAVLYE